MKNLILIIVLLFSFVGFSQKIRVEETPKRVTIIEVVSKEPNQDLTLEFKNLTPEGRKKYIIPVAKLQKDFHWAEYAKNEPMKAGILIAMKLDKYPVEILCIITEKKISNTKYLYQFRPNPEIYEGNSNPEFVRVMKGMTKFDIVISVSPGVLESQTFDYKGNVKYSEPTYISKISIHKGENSMSFSKTLLPYVSKVAKENANRKIQSEKFLKALEEENKRRKALEEQQVQDTITE
jgi:hypothetical protein